MQFEYHGIAFIFSFHYSDAIWASWRLKTLARRMYIQPNGKE